MAKEISRISSDMRDHIDYPTESPSGLTSLTCDYQSLLIKRKKKTHRLSHQKSCSAVEIIEGMGGGRGGYGGVTNIHSGINLLQKHHTKITTRRL